MQQAILYKLCIYITTNMNIYNRTVAKQHHNAIMQQLYL